MYQAIVANIHTRPHPGADRIQLGTVCGHQVVCGLDIADGTLGVFFPCDGQLSHDFCVANDEYPRLDEQGKKVGGGFINPKNRRVKAQSFRGEKSDGYWVPMDKLIKWANHVWREDDKGDHVLLSNRVQSLVEGDTFDSVGDVPLCNKYVTEKTLKALQNQAKQARKTHTQFAQHIDTKQFRYNIGNIPEGSIVWISEKLHGTSGRYGYVQALRELGGRFNAFVRRAFDWCADKLGLDVSPKYEHVMGSRRVELSAQSEGFYGSIDFRANVANKLKGNLLKGECIYGELVGWTGPDSLIMGRHSTKKLGKELRKQYGEEVTYTYGQPNGCSEFFVYRITRVGPDGQTIELGEREMRARARVLGFKTPELFAGPMVVHDYADDKWVDGGKTLMQVVEAYLNGPSIEDSRHPREGVVIRVDRPDGTTIWLKDKNHPFKVMEGIAKDSGEADMEESS
jgi:hypothetical protein